MLNHPKLLSWNILVPIYKCDWKSDNVWFILSKNGGIIFQFLQHERQHRKLPGFLENPSSKESWKKSQGSHALAQRPEPPKTKKDDTFSTSARYVMTRRLRPGHVQQHVARLASALPLSLATHFSGK